MTAAAPRAVFRTPWLTVREALESEPSGTQRSWYYLDHPGCALVLPVTADGTLLLIRSWRIAVRQWCLEAPAGRCEPGESPEETARRELAEETGARAGALHPLGTVWPSSGSSNEEVHLFLAPDVRSGMPHHDDGEVIRQRPVPVDDALALAISGELQDGPTALALLRAHRRGLLPAVAPASAAVSPAALTDSATAEARPAATTAAPLATPGPGPAPKNPKEAR
ncbi:NUDIX hydrolase [Streptomyces spongiae]|uniref:NUDIX hydrolase n=1 Tax=Streptomyces spongiae TaxID=565072 RepID=A0A5N8XI35_9ACTN|nr:NUDIX hydrolase [Streptomyces spongiae]MPY58638.1 NUDIX hydrolase [Streptomyces spongiae]